MRGRRRPLREALDIGPEDRPVCDQLPLCADQPDAPRSRRGKGYDKYLKANRVERGVESYDAVVQLILGTGLDQKGNPQLPIAGPRLAAGPGGYDAGSS